LLRVPTSADGLEKLTPGSMTFGLGRVIVCDAANLNSVLSKMLQAKLAAGSQFSYRFSVKAKLRMFG
jgi:hypothetical protein